MPRINSTTIPGVQQKAYRDQVYYYHRKTQERITGEPGTPEFKAHLDRLNAQVAAKTAAPVTVKGTLGDLIAAYKSSYEFSSLAERTRADYAHKLDWLNKPSTMLAALATFNRPDVIRIRDLALKTHKWHFANYVVTVMSAMFKWGVEREHMPYNPAAGIDKLTRPKHLPKRNRVWTSDEKEAVLAAAEGGIKVCIALGMFAGAREQDAVAMTWRAIGKDGYIEWTMKKTGDEQRLRINMRLAALLEEAKGDTAPLPSRHIVVGSRSGAPYTLNGFRAIFNRLLQRLEREGKIADGLTFHGLRHTIGAEIASRGGSTTMIQTALGHRSPAMANHYSKEYDKQRSGDDAIDLLEREKGV
jgi:integrase